MPGTITEQFESQRNALMTKPAMIPDAMRIRYQTHAEEACRRLVNAYCNDHEQVDWSDIQEALGEALKAFDLPEDYPEMVTTRRFRRVA